MPRRAGLYSRQGVQASVIPLISVKLCLIRDLFRLICTLISIRMINNQLETRKTLPRSVILDINPLSISHDLLHILRGIANITLALRIPS